MAKKEFTFYGHRMDELRKMSLEEFASLIPARERRSLLKRGLTDAEKRFLERLRKNPDKQLRTHCRNLIIIPEMVGRQIRVHNGKEFVFLEIKKEMLGHRLGEFVDTRKRVKHSSPGMGATRSSKFIPLK